MTICRISEDAEGDLQRIYQRGVLEFGEVQADQYFDTFFERIVELAEQPKLYQAVDEIREGYRRSVCGSASNDYRVVDDTVEIMRILDQQDVNEWL